jgi:FdhD protein
MTQPARTATIVRCDERGTRTDHVLLAVEEPLIVTVRHATSDQSHSLGMLMRTPGDDVDLAIGLLHADGLVRTATDIVDVATSTRDETACIDVIVVADVDVSRVVERRQITTSACGLCGRAELQALARRGPLPPLTVARHTIAELPGRLRAHQAVFAETGGLHAAALMNAEVADDLVREDVGRHNAVDKVVGAALRAGRLPAARHILVVSGRLAYEIVQKAAIAGLQVIVAVGAPSSLAVDAARAAGVTLIGFARDGRFNVYAGVERVQDR